MPTDPYRVFAKVWDYRRRTNLYDAYYPFVSDLIDGMDREVRTVYDAACGTGVLGAMLVADGYDVVGVDVSPAMLARARRRPLSVVRGDVRTRVLAADSCEFALCTSNALNYLHDPAELESALSATREVLTDDALFVFDVFTEVQDVDAEYEAGNYAVEESSRAEGDVLVIEVTVREDTGDGVREYHETHRERVHPVPRLRRCLDAAGFEVRMARDGPSRDAAATDLDYAYVVAAAR